MQQNFENFKKYYHLSKTYTYFSCQVWKCGGLIFIVLLYYTMLLVLNYYSLDSTDVIKYTYFITATILKILFIVLLFNHYCRLIYSDNYQLEWIYKHLYLHYMVDSSNEQLDEQFYRFHIGLVDLLISKPIFIVLAVLSVIDFAFVQYQLFEPYTELQLINYILILVPCCVLALSTIVLFILFQMFKKACDRIIQAVVAAICEAIFAALFSNPTRRTRRATTAQQQDPIKIQSVPQDQISIQMRTVPQGQKCVICQIEYNTWDKVEILPCSLEHLFHVKCLQEWRKNHNFCPICRKPI